MRSIDTAISGDCFVFDGDSFRHVCVAPETFIVLLRENKELSEWKARTLSDQNAKSVEIIEEPGKCARAILPLMEEISERDTEILHLREALEQLLDDMGDDGHCVCEAAKQQAIAVINRGR